MISQVSSCSIPMIIPSMARKPEKMARIVQIWNCINAVGLNVPSDSYSWARLKRIKGAPLQVKIVWLGMVRDEFTFPSDLVKLWTSMSDRQKDKYFPVIKRWIIEDFQNPKCKWEYLKDYSTLWKDFLERGIVDGCDDDTKAIVLNRILCSLSNSGDLETIQKILPECKNGPNQYRASFFAIRGGHIHVLKFLISEGFSTVELKELSRLPNHVISAKIIDIINIIQFDAVQAADLLRYFFKDRREISTQLIKRLVDLDHPMLDETYLKPYLKQLKTNVEIPLQGLRYIDCLFKDKYSNPTYGMHEITKEVFDDDHAMVYDMMLCYGVDMYEYCRFHANHLPIESVTRSYEVKAILSVFQKHGYNFSYPLANGETLLESWLSNSYDSNSKDAIRFLLTETDYLLQNPDAINILATQQNLSENQKWIEICLEKGQRFWNGNSMIEPETAFEIVIRIGNVGVLREWPGSFPKRVSFEWILKSKNSLEMYEFFKDELDITFEEACQLGNREVLAQWTDPIPQGEEAKEAFLNAVKTNNIEAIVWVIENCHVQLDLEDASLLKEVQKVEIILRLIQLFREQQIPCYPDLCNLLMWEKYDKYEKIADKLTVEEIEISLREADDYLVNKLYEKRESINNFEQIMSTIAKVSPAALCDHDFEFGADLFSFISQNPQVLENKKMALPIMKQLLKQFSEEGLSYLKKVVENRFKKPWKAKSIFYWFFKHASQFNQTEEVYLAILNCFDLPNLEELPFDELYECRYNWPRRGFWNALKTWMSDKGVDFSVNRGWSVLHLITIYCRSWAHSWEQRLPKNSEEWKECEEVVLSMIQYACEHGVLEHQDVKESPYFGESILGKMARGDKCSILSPEGDALARAVFFELVKYPIYEKGMNLLACACHLQWTTLVKQLVAMGHSIHEQDPFFDETPIWLVRSHGNLKLALALTSK